MDIAWSEWNEEGLLRASVSDSFLYIGPLDPHPQAKSVDVQRVETKEDPEIEC